MSLTGAGVIDVEVGLTLVLGANLGSSLAPLALSLRGPIEVRQALVGNLLTRTAGVLLILPFIGAIEPAIAAVEANAARQVADFHTAFNIAVAVVFLPFVAMTARMLRSLVPPPPAVLGEQPLAMLDEGDFDQPSVALVAASR
jgi:phosphate:Na+ symporter